MLSIKDFGFRYHQNDPYIFRDLTFDIEAGSLVRLEGSNGSGKSTFIYCLTGFFCQYLGGEIEGCIDFKGEDIHDMPVKQRIQTINAVFQDPEVQISFAVAFEELKCQLLYCENLSYDKEQQINELLHRFGLNISDSTKTSELSWGQKKMICLISLIVNDPPVWLLDEPFSGLSVAHSDILAHIILEKLQQGRIILFSDHTSYPITCHQTIRFSYHDPN